MEIITFSGLKVKDKIEKVTLQIWPKPDTIVRNGSNCGLK